MGARVRKWLWYSAQVAIIWAVVIALVYSCGACSRPQLTSRMPVDPGEITEATRYMLQQTVQVTAICSDGVSHGSGVILTSTKQGTLIATAKHVGEDDCLFSVKNQFGRAAITHRSKSPDYDVAYLYTETRLPAGEVRLAKPVFGARVYTVGYPSDRVTEKPRLTFSTGVVMTWPYEGGYVRMSAHILGGSSGGPVWDANGRLVGIVVSMYGARFLGRQFIPYDGHYYALSSHHVARELAKLAGPVSQPSSEPKESQ